jgi:carbamoyltransferase
LILLGISCGHDASACLVVDGVLIADAAEERFTRVKHDAGFPSAAIAYCLSEARIGSEEIDVVAIADLFLPLGPERYFVLTPEQSASLAASRPIEARARQMLINTGSRDLPLYMRRFALSPKCRLICVEHHLCHAAASYFTRGRSDRCLIVTMDGIGDNVSVAVWRGEGNEIAPLARWGRDASFGWFYSNVTEALGWQHGDGEGTIMGLAPYGDPDKVGDRLDQFHPAFLNGELVRPHEFGPASFINDHGNYHWHFRDADGIREVATACGHENVAARAQEIIEQQVVSIIQHWTKTLDLRRLACSGGLFLNVKLNQRVWYDLRLEEHWIYPNPGDAGLGVGAALHTWHTMAQPTTNRKLEHLYYGPGYSDSDVRSILDARQLSYREVEDPSLEAAHLLADNKIVGWFQGRMEAGPRALGNRSILMRASSAENKAVLNAKVKFRETFRPFCPALLFEKKDEYLRNGREENFMITSFDVTTEKRGLVPAVVHVDGTLRPQTVKRDTNPRFYDLIKHFGDLTGEYLVLNTSLNIKGEPIVCHPREAIRCFFDTGLDALIVGNFVLIKPGVRTEQTITAAT